MAIYREKRSRAGVVYFDIESEAGGYVAGPHYENRHARRFAESTAGIKAKRAKPRQQMAAAKHKTVPTSIDHH